MKQLLFIIILVLTISCAPIYVNYDYESGTDFNKYTTYMFLEDEGSGLSRFDTDRLFDAIDAVMKTKDLSPSATPNFLISVISREYRDDARSTVGVGVGGTGRNVGGGISVGIPVGRDNVLRELVFEIIDAKTNQLQWQAISESRFNPNASPETKEEQLKTIVAKVFSEYPPQK